MSPPLARALQELATHFEGCGWTVAGPPTRVLAMTQHPADGVEHTLFVTAPLPQGELPDPEAAGLACTVNVHYPGLEDCINQALDRDSGDAGRQSLRLSLARLAPPEHLFKGVVHVLRCDPSAPGLGSAPLRADFDRYLEPLRQRLCRLDVLAAEPLSPRSVDPWTWQMRRAAYLQLHADKATARRFLTGLQEQASQVLQGDATAALRLSQRGAREALALAQALLHPRQRVIRIAAGG